jgi:hypothetical protein
MNNPGENANLRRFLLGNESEAEAEEIGVRLIGDPEFAENMSFAEESLVEEFLDDELTADEKALFYRNFLTTPARKELLEETALFRNHARDQHAETTETSPDEKKSAGFIDGLINFLTLNLRPVAAVLLILVVAVIAWRVFLYDASGLTATEKEYAALNARDLSGGTETANLSNKSLIAGTFRDTDAASRLTFANLTENVFFRLALPAETSRDTCFDLELVRGGQTVFRQTGLRVYQNPNGQELKIILPKSVLSKGTYQIKLNSGATYGFAVE